MAVSKSFGAILLAGVAALLTVTGVVIAATDANPSAGAKDHLALNGYPPKSANLLVTMSTGQSYGLSANVNVNFLTNAIAATVSFPLIFSVGAVNVRLVDNHLFATSASTSLGSWIELPYKLRSLFGYSLELTKPDIALISGFGQEVITKSNDTTTYTYTRNNVVVSNILSTAEKTVGLATLVWNITTGRQGEVTSSSVIISSKHSTTKISAVVVSYNQPAHIVAPPTSDVHPVPSSLLRQIFSSSLLKSVMLPQNLTSLRASQLN
jgi:hypothetical protein